MEDPKMSKFILLLVGFSLLALVACGPGTLEPKAYVNWVRNEENGLVKSKTLRNLEFTAQYKPLDYIVAMEEKKERLESDFVQKRKEELGEDLMYFNFRIEAPKGENPMSYQLRNEQERSIRMSYFMGNIQDHLYVLHDSDTLKCIDFMYVRNYELAPYIDFTLGFGAAGKKPEDLGDVKFVYDDQLYGTGKVNLGFRKREITTIPTLKTI